MFRLRPNRPLDPGVHYTIQAETTAYGRVQFFAQAFTFAAPESRQLTVGPTDDMGDVPLNAIVWVRAQTPLDILTFKPRITAGDTPVTYTVTFYEQGFLAQIRPAALLRGNTTYTVTLNGLEDGSGRPFPDRTWTFHTGAGPSFTPTAMTSWAPKGTGSPSSPLRLTFNQPVCLMRQEPQTSGTYDPHDFVQQFPTIAITGSVVASKDGRTSSYVPARPWPTNTSLSLGFDRSRYFDWTGAAVGLSDGGYSSPGPGFLTGPAATAALPRVEAKNPYDGAVGVPLNVEIQVRFADGILESSLSRIRLEADGVAVAMRAALAADGRTLTVLPELGLQQNRKYTVSLDGVQNSEGAEQESVAQWSFTTSGTLQTNDTTALAIPMYGDPFSMKLQLERPVNPLSVDETNLGLSIRGSVRISGGVRVESEGRIIRVTPREPVPDGTTVTLSTASLRDWAGNSITANGTFRTGALAVRDTAPPRVQTILPSPDSTVSWNSSAALVFDEPVYLRDGAAGVRVVSRGQIVPASARLTASARTVFINPDPGWLPGEGYDVEVGGILDLSGNEASPVKWSFSIAADGTAQAGGLRPVSTTPAANAVGVPTDSPVVFEFTRAVVPRETYYNDGTDLTQTDAGRRVPIPHSSAYDGTRVRIVATGTLPPGRSILASAQMQDAFSSSATGSTLFSTAAIVDTTPPTLESVTPAAGSQLPAGRTDFVLQFSEPVTVSGNWALFARGGQTAGPSQTSRPSPDDGRTLIATFDLQPDGSGTLSILNQITDLSGNKFEAQSLEYTVLTSDQSYQPYVKSIRPADGATGIPRDAAIELTFSQPMAEESLAAAIRADNDGYSVALTFSHDDAKQVWLVTPAGPFAANSVVRIEVLTGAYAMTGAILRTPFVATFKTAADGGSATVTGVLATAETVDVHFEGPHWGAPEEPFGIRLGQQRIPVRVDQAGPAWLRLTPEAPLEAGRQYHLMAGPGVEFPLRIEAGEVKQRATRRAARAARAIRETPGLIRVELDGDVHPFAVDDEFVQVVDGTGHAVPHRLRIGSDGRSVTVELFGKTGGCRLIVNGNEVAVPGSPLAAPL